MHILQNIAMFFGIMLFTAHEYLTAFILVTVILASVVGGISTLAGSTFWLGAQYTCLLYTSDAADDLLCVDLGGRRIIKKKKSRKF